MEHLLFPHTKTRVDSKTKAEPGILNLEDPNPPQSPFLKGGYRVIYLKGAASDKFGS